MGTKNTWTTCGKQMILVILLPVTVYFTWRFNYKLLGSLNILKMRFENSVSNFPLSFYMDDYYVLRTPGCLIERLDPWDLTLTEFIRKLDTFSCPQDAIHFLIFKTDDGFLKVNETAKKNLFRNESVTKDWYCYKREIYRKHIEEKDWKDYRLSTNATKFWSFTKMEEEYVQVQCYVNNKNIYHNYFFNIIRKPHVESKCKENFQKFVTEHPKCGERPQLSVLLIGIDSLSKSNFLRQMPFTFDFLVNKLQGVDMMGYNKVGINTFPSLIPYLTGNSSDELKKGCWGGNPNTFDKCTFIWDMFSRAGYRTAFVENMDYASLLNFDKYGSKRQLADYYGHTVYMLVEKYALKNGCWRGQANDAQVAEWAFQFQKQFADDAHFGHFWMSSFSHDYLTKPRHLDPTLSNLFRNMNSTGILNNTLLIFMSDHGIRYGKIRETEIGRQESNLPFMILVFPEWFRERYPTLVSRLRENRHRLITTFDLHETLKDIIKCDYVNMNFEKPKLGRGISLFKPISIYRTCASAGIPDIYCACKEDIVEIDPYGIEADQLAEALIIQLNNITQPVRHVCVRYGLNQIISLKKIFSRTENYKKVPNSVYKAHVITISVKPSDAKFEAIIEAQNASQSIKVNPDIRRISRYGNSSYCVRNDAALKSICYCRSLIITN